MVTANITSWVQQQINDYPDGDEFPTSEPESYPAGFSNPTQPDPSVPGGSNSLQSYGGFNPRKWTDGFLREIHGPVVYGSTYGLGWMEISGATWVYPGSTIDEIRFSVDLYTYEPMFNDTGWTTAFSLVFDNGTTTYDINLSSILYMPSPDFEGTEGEGTTTFRLTKTTGTNYRLYANILGAGESAIGSAVDLGAYITADVINGVGDAKWGLAYVMGGTQGTRHAHPEDEKFFCQYTINSIQVDFTGGTPPPATSSQIIRWK